MHIVYMGKCPKYYTKRCRSNDKNRKGKGETKVSQNEFKIKVEKLTRLVANSQSLLQ